MKGKLLRNAFKNISLIESVEDYAYRIIDAGLEKVKVRIYSELSITYVVLNAFKN